MPASRPSPKEPCLHRSSHAAWGFLTASEDSSAKFQNLVRRNRFVADNRTGSANGNGIYSDQGVQRVLITANEFESNENAGILFASAGTTQKQLTIERNDSRDDTTFVALFNTATTTVAFNNGIDVTATGVGAVEVRRNSVRKSHQDGLYLGSTTQANLILDNFSKDNGGSDCEDDSMAGTFVGTAGTANTWYENSGPDASPAAICD